MARGLTAAEQARMPQQASAETQTPEVSAVIVTWNAGETLLDCVQSLLASEPPGRLEVTVIDNGSTDGSIEELRHRCPSVRVINNRRNRGLAAANNQGIVAARAPFVLISNPDVIYPPGAVDALVDLLRRRDRAAFAVARHTHPDGTLQTSAGDLPGVADALLGRRLSWGARPHRSRVWWHDWAHDEERPIGHGAEACYLVRREAVAEIGLQDERFVLDWEGLNWSARAQELGWEVWFCPQATVTHIGGVSLRQVPGRWIASTHLGMYLYLRERTPRVARPLLAAAVAARAMLKATLLAVGSQLYESRRRDERAL